MSNMAELAVAYHRLGYRIHPVRPASKVPLLEAWPKHCYRDESEVVHQWQCTPEANVGLVLGRHDAAPEALVAFDCDGAAFLKRALALLPPTPARTISGSGEGGHLLYRWRQGVVCPAKRRCEVGAPGQHQEIAFLGSGSQVVLPGSIHPTTGNPYRWAHAPEDPLAILPAHSLPIIGPEALLAFAPMAQRPDSESRRTRGRSPSVSSSTREQLLDACEARGLRVRRLAPGKWAIECPWRNEHSNGAQAESDTVVLDRAPWFKCLHSHCASRSIDDLTVVLGVEATAAPKLAVAASARPEAGYPDSFDIAGFSFNCLPTSQDADCRRWLSERGLFSDFVDEADLAVALGPGALPRWATCAGHSWQEAGYRMALPLWSPVPDAAGRLRVVSVMARHVAQAPEDTQVVTAAGYTRRCLILATGSDALADGRARRLVTVCSGPDDFLALAHWPASARGAVIGSLPRSSPGDAVGLIPEGWTVALAMPTTMAGDDEARQWKRRLDLRGCTVVRCPLGNGRTK